MKLSVENAFDSGTTKWFHNGAMVSADCQGLDQAIPSGTGKTILALGAGRTRLYGFMLDGTRKFEVSAPEGFSFSHLVQHPEIGTAVVCGSAEKVDGWFDWHFSVDENQGIMKRYCPAH